MFRRTTLGLATMATVFALVVLPLQQRRSAPAGWLDDLCPAARVEAVA
jgi:hypothetical protein